MKKNLLLIPLISLFMFCDKSQESNEEDGYYAKLLKEYGIDDIFSYEEYNDKNTYYILPIQEFNDSTIFFYGELSVSPDFGLIGFNSKTKEKLFDLIHLNRSVTVSKPYGENITFDIHHAAVSKLFDYGGGDMVISAAFSEGNGSSDYKAFNFFFKKGELSEMIEIVIGGVGLESGGIYKWNDKIMSINPYNGLYHIIIYDRYGVVLKDIGYIKEYIFGNNTSTNVILNDFEVIFIQNNTSVTKLNFLSINSNNSAVAWTSKIDLGNYDRPRVDSIDFLSRNEFFIEYSIFFTEYSGNKIILKMSANIENGEIIFSQQN